MMMRKIALCVIIFSIVSLFVAVPFVAAHGGTQAEIDALKEAEIDLKNVIEKRQEPLNEKYNGAKAAVDELFKEWNQNETSIRDNYWDIGNAAAATAISLIMEAVLTKDPDDGGATKEEWLKELVEHLPTVLSGINAGKKIWNVSDGLSKRAAYVLALHSAVAALDQVISENEKAFKTYESKYDIYLDKMQNHRGGLVRVPDYSDEGDYNSVTALSLQEIKDIVKAADAYHDEDKKNMLKYWYHVNDLKNDSEASSKMIEAFQNKSPHWKTAPFYRRINMRAVGSVVRNTGHL